MTSPLPSAAEARAVYGRLLGYARPWRAQFLVGVLGMALYAATDAGIAWFVDRFIKHAFVDMDPRVVWAVPLGVLLLFLLRGVGDYVATYFPAKVGRHVVKAIRNNGCGHDGLRIGKGCEGRPWDKGGRHLAICGAA